MCLMLFHDMQVPHARMTEVDQQIVKNVLKQVSCLCLFIQLLSNLNHQFAMLTVQETQNPESAVINGGRLTQVLNFLTEVGRRVGMTAPDSVVPLVSIINIL